MSGKAKEKAPVSVEVNEASERKDLAQLVTKGLDTIKDGIDVGIRKYIELNITNEVSTNDLKSLLGLIEQFQQDARKNPEILKKIIEKIQGIAGKNDEKSSETADRFNSVVERIQKGLEGMQNALGNISADTLQTLETFLGPDSFLGKIFGMVKKTDKSLGSYAAKMFARGGQKVQGATLVPVESEDPKESKKFRSDLTAETAIMGAVKQQVSTSEKPGVDIVEHVKLLVGELLKKPKGTILVEEDFLNASTNVLAKTPLEKPAEVAAVATERKRLAVLGKEETLPTRKDSKDVMKLSKKDTNLTVKVGNNTMTLGNVASVEIEPDSFIFIKLIDGNSNTREVKVDAAEIAGAQKGLDSKVKVQARSTTANTSEILEFNSEQA